MKVKKAVSGGGPLRTPTLSQVHLSCLPTPSPPRLPSTPALHALPSTPLPVAPCFASLPHVFGVISTNQ